MTTTIMSSMSVKPFRLPNIVRSPSTLRERDGGPPVGAPVVSFVATTDPR